MPGSSGPSHGSRGVGGSRASINDFPSPGSTGSHSTSTARLVSEGSGYRYVNNHLWNAISTDPHASTGRGESSPGGRRPSPTGSRTGQGIHEEIARPVGADSPAGRSFVFNNGTSQPLPNVLEAPASHVVLLWQVFQSNVDPIMKISHAPSVQTILLGQVGRPSLPRNEQALAFAIYFISVVSLSEEQCQQSLGQPRAQLIDKYRDASEASLSAAGFITTTDIMVLQALVYYLVALRSLGEVQTVWSMLGIAIRIAGTFGLARDGASLGLSPFETEMRRRLWWGLVYLDGRMAEVVGQDGDLMGVNFDAGPPANLNDSDLFPTMIRLPESRRGPSEAIYLQARVLSITVARSLQSITGPQGTWHRLHDASMPTHEKLEIMESIQRRYDLEILEPCDSTVPLQWLSINTAKTFATKLRLIARIPIIDADREWEDSEGFSENAFLLSMDLVQTQLDLWEEPSVQQWKWHWQAHFQWYALVTLLRQTRLKHSGRGASRAWGLIKKVFDTIIPDLELGPRKSLLLDGIHALLNAAKRQQNRGGAEASHPARNNLLMDNRPSPGPKSPSGPSTPYPYGTRPHNSFLPNITSAHQIPTPTNFGRSYLEHQHEAVMGLDLDTIDWAEFDRLATELYQQ